MDDGDDDGGDGDDGIAADGHWRHLTGRRVLGMRMAQHSDRMALT